MTELIDRLTGALEGRYRIEGRLGEGGMATVYLAEDLKHDRQVAIKVLRPELAAVIGGDRFLAEIKTTANLQHPHILPLFDSGEADRFLYFVMPYIDGETLQDRIDREKQLPVDEAVSIATKVAGALHAAHEKGIVHRDIKPANILLAGGEPLVADFGIALAVQEAGGGRLTETGLSLGTPYYMSPEQATADRDPDARSDIYSLGCVLYESLVGEPPFQGGTAQAILGRILTAEPARPTEVRRSIPAHVEAAVLRALEKLPADRFPTAAEMARALSDPGSVQFATQAGARSGPRHAPAGVGADSGRSRVSPIQLIPWGLAAAAVLVAMSSLGGDGAPEADPIRFTLESRAALSGERGSRNVQISADGKSIVYRGAADGRTLLFHRSLDRNGATPIPGTEDPEFHAISPDSRWLAFVGADGVLKRVPLEGGAPAVMAEPENAPIGMTWSSPTQLELGMLAFNSNYPGLSTVSFDSREIRTRTGPPSDFDGDGWAMHHEPHALPGGTHVLFLDFSSEFADVGLGIAELASGESRRLDLKGSLIRSSEGIVGVTGDVLLYIDRGGRLMAIAWNPGALETVGQPITVPGVPEEMIDATLAENGTLALTLATRSYTPVLVDDRGRVVRTLWDEGVARFYPRMSPDGRKLAADIGIRGSRDLWVFDFESGALTQAGLGNAGAPIWTDGGQSVVVGSDLEFLSADDESGLSTPVSRSWIRPVDASRDRYPLTEYRGAIRDLVDISPDGRSLLFVDDKERNPSVRRFDLLTTEREADSIVRPFTETDQNEFGGRFSPDGRWIAYTSNESGRTQVYVRPFPGPGARAQISQEPAGEPVWDPSGNRLYYRDSRGLMAATLVTENDRLSVRGRERLFDLEFQRSSDYGIATYDVHPEGFVLAIDETDTDGRIVVWADWMHEIGELLNPDG
jgi:serine/threonine-protein kinase